MRNEDVSTCNHTLTRLKSHNGINANQMNRGIKWFDNGFYFSFTLSNSQRPRDENYKSNLKARRSVDSWLDFEFIC